MDKITRNSRKTPENISENEKIKEIADKETLNEEEKESKVVPAAEETEKSKEKSLVEDTPKESTSKKDNSKEDKQEKPKREKSKKENENKKTSSKADAKVKSKEKRKKKFNYKKLVSFLVILVIAALAVFGITKGANAIIDYISSSVDVAPETKEITINSTGNLAYEKFQKGVLIANEGTIAYHNSKNEVVWEKRAFDGSPVIKTNDRYALVSYAGTPNALLVNGPNTIPVTGNGNIVTSCVNKNGYFALVMSEEGYKNQIVVFDNYGNVIYKWHSAENYVTCVAISPDNKNMAASTIGFGGNKFSNGVMIFDFAQEKPFAGQQEEDNIIMNIDYVAKKRLVVIGDKKTSYYKTNGKKIRDIDYEGKNLTTYDVCDSGTTVLCFSKDDSVMSNSDIYSYNERGRQKGHFETEGRALSISCDSNKILVAKERVFDILGENCRKKSSVTVLKDIKNSVLFDGGKYAFVISGNTARVIKV